MRIFWGFTVYNALKIFRICEKFGEHHNACVCDY